MSSSRPLAIVTGARRALDMSLPNAASGRDLTSLSQPTSRPSMKRRGNSAAWAPRSRPSNGSRDDRRFDRLYRSIQGRPVDALLANAGHGSGKRFLDQNFDDVRHVVDTNVTGTLYLLQKVARDMRARGMGRILITGSIAGFIPGTYQAVYNGTKAFLDSSSFALRHELKDTGVTVTCLMPGATETQFFERADMMDTKVGQEKKDDPAEVAQTGFDAMMRGDGDVVTGWKNKLQSAIASVTPSDILAEMHRKMAKPGSGRT